MKRRFTLGLAIVTEPLATKLLPLCAAPVGLFLHTLFLFLSSFVLEASLTVQRSSILINRGWVPKDKKDPSTRPETLVLSFEMFQDV